MIEPRVVVTEDTYEVEIPSECPRCSYTSSDPSCILLHIGSHFASTEFVCPYDYSVFPTKDDLEAHLLLHQQQDHPETIVTKACGKCGRLFEESTLKAHFVAVHGYKGCYLCTAVSRSSDALRKHIHRYHKGYQLPTPDDADGPLKGPYAKCSKCGVYYINYPHYIREHQLSAHLEDVVAACTFCATVCFTRKSLSAHVSKCSLRTKYPKSVYWRNILKIEDGRARCTTRLNKLKELAKMPAAERLKAVEDLPTMKKYKRHSEPIDEHQPSAIQTTGGQSLCKLLPSRRKRREQVNVE